MRLRICQTLHFSHTQSVEVFMRPRGCTFHFSGYVGLNPASTVYLTKIQIKVSLKYYVGTTPTIKFNGIQNELTLTGFHSLISFFKPEKDIKEEQGISIQNLIPKRWMFYNT